MESSFVVIPAMSSPQPLQSGELGHIWAMRDSLAVFRNSATEIEDRRAKVEGEPNRRAPLRIALDGPFKNVVDFIFPVAVSDCVAKDDVALEIMKNFKGLEEVDVSIVTKSGTPNTKAIKAGVKLVQLIARQWVSLDRERTSFRDEDGRAVIDGLEWLDFTNEYQQGKEIVRRRPRIPGQGYYIKASELDGCDLFHVDYMMGVLCCTDRFRDFVLKRQYTNIDFCEMGALI